MTSSEPIYDSKNNLLLRVIDAMSEAAHHFTMSERIGRVWSESELCSENGLTLETGTLSNEQVVEVAKKGHSVHI